jgi:hypothetical protein
VGVNVSREWKISKEYWARAGGKEGEFEEPGHGVKASLSILALLVLLISCLFKNCQLQATYFMELMTDANGILVLLKFISEKTSECEKKGAGPEHSLAVSAVVMSLFLLCACCLSYPDRVEEFQFAFNSYLMFEKVPAQFHHPKVESYCHDMIKAQLPFFTEKMKEFGKAMRIAGEVYCKLTTKFPPKVLSK